MEDKAKTTKYFSDNLTPGLLKHAKCFYFRGKSLMRELSWWDRLLLKMGAKFAKGERDRKEMLTEFNAVERGNTHELIKAVKESLGT